MRIRRIHLLAIPAVLIALLLIAEPIYRRQATRDLDRVVAGVRQAHASRDNPSVAFVRFGKAVDRCRPSMLEDAWEAAVYRCLPKSSRLLREGTEDLLNPYASVSIVATGDPSDSGQTFHKFLWSPARWRFVGVPMYACSFRDCPAFSPITECRR